MHTILHVEEDEEGDEFKNSCYPGRVILCVPSGFRRCVQEIGSSGTL